MGEASRRSYEFGPFVLDPGKRLLFRNGEQVPLAPKVLETLVALVEHRDRVLAKEQLLDLVWGEMAVEEGGLARNVSLLRKTLGEKPDEHRYIVTIPGRGYQFVAEVREMFENELPLSRITSAVAAAGSQRAPAGEPSVPQHRRWSASWLAAGMVGLLTIAGTAPNWFSSASSFFGSRPLSAPRLIRLTSTSGLNIDAALSADGTLLAYASDRAGAGNLDIWVQPVRGGSPKRITNGAGDEVDPSFSPDGGAIAFSGGEAGGIYVVGAHGGEPRLVAQGARTRTPRFSPDGRSIVYWTGQNAWVGSLLPGVTGALGVVSSNGGSPRPLAHEFASARYAIWSPDGTKILFLGEHGSDSGSSLDWYVVNAEGGSVIRTGGLEAIRAGGVSGTPIPGGWTLQGNVVFTTTDEATSSVWQLPVSPASGRVTGSATRLTFGTAIERGAAVSNAGRIAFSSLSENVDAWRVALDPTTGLASGVLERVTDDAAEDRVMNVSNDGSTLAFISSRTKQNQVWLKNLATRVERQITVSDGDSARVSPDGSRVALQQRAGGEGHVQLHEANGGRPTILCDDCLLLGGGWSSDGSRILITRQRSPQRRLILDVGSRREVELTSHPSWTMFQARFSRDDRWVVFHAATGPDRRQVYAVPAFLDRPVAPNLWVPVVTDFGIYPSFSPSGTGVYHFSIRDGHMCAWLQPVDPLTKRPSGLPQPVQHFHQPRLRAATRSTPTNDVNAGYLYVTLTETTGNIWMLDPAKQ